MNRRDFLKVSLFTKAFFGIELFQKYQSTIPKNDLQSYEQSVQTSKCDEIDTLIYGVPAVLWDEEVVGELRTFTLYGVKKKYVNQLKYFAFLDNSDSRFVLNYGKIQELEVIDEKLSKITIGETAEVEFSKNDEPDYVPNYYFSNFEKLKNVKNWNDLFTFGEIKYKTVKYLLPDGTPEGEVFNFGHFYLPKDGSNNHRII